MKCVYRIPRIFNLGIIAVMVLLSNPAHALDINESYEVRRQGALTPSLDESLPRDPSPDEANMLLQFTAIKPDAAEDNPLVGENSIRAGEIQLAAAQAAVAAAAAASGSSGLSDEDRAIAEAMLNPLSYLWLLFAQNDTIWYDGDTLDDLNEDTKVQNSTLLMPVFSFQLTEEWKTIFRPVIPINSFETLDNVDISTGSPNPGSITGVDFDRETGLGDIVLWTAFSKQYKPPFIFGFGPTVMLDTATEEQLGTGKYSAGPMALAFKISDKWVNGIVAQHWWSFAGEDKLEVDTNLGKVKAERPDVSLTDLQVVVRYRHSALTNIGMAPNWRYNWENRQWDLPIGIGFDTLIKLGKLPVKIGAEVYYFVEKSDDFGPDWQFRFLFVPVVPSPKWSKEPIFK